MTPGLKMSCISTVGRGLTLAHGNEEGKEEMSNEEASITQKILIDTPVKMHHDFQKSS